MIHSYTLNSNLCRSEKVIIFFDAQCSLLCAAMASVLYLITSLSSERWLAALVLKVHERPWRPWCTFPHDQVDLGGRCHCALAKLVWERRRSPADRG